MSSDIVSHNVSGILLTLWLTLWEDCEKFVSGDEYPYYQLLSDTELPFWASMVAEISVLVDYQFDSMLVVLSNWVCLVS